MKKASNEAHFVGKFVGKNNNNLQVIENNKKNKINGGGGSL